MSRKSGQSPRLAPEHRVYIATESAISVVINGVFSLLFAWVVFGDRASVELWGARGLAVDFAPQSVMIALMSTLVPTMLTRSRLKQAKVARAPIGVYFLPANVLLRSLAMAALALIIGSSITIALLSVLMTGPLTITAVYVIKVAYGCLLALAVTPVAIGRALSDL